MIHDQTASVMSLARTVLAGLDERNEQSSVRTATLVLLLQTLLDLGAPNQNQRVAESARTQINSVMASFTAVKEHG